MTLSTGRLRKNAGNIVIPGRGLCPRARNPRTLARQINGLAGVPGFRARPCRAVPERHVSFSAAGWRGPAALSLPGPRLRAHPPAIMFDREDVAVQGRDP